MNKSLDFGEDLKARTSLGPAPTPPLGLPEPPPEAPAVKTKKEGHALKWTLLGASAIALGGGAFWYLASKDNDPSTPGEEVDYPASPGLPSGGVRAP